MRKKHVAMVAVLALVLGAAVLAVASRRSEVATPAVTVQTYDSTERGISFTYPSTFTLEEGPGEEGSSSYVITLTREADRVSVEGGEGPTSVTVALYENTNDQQSLVDWVTGSSRSNYRFATADYSETSVAGSPALSYSWSGLYEADTTVFRKRGNIVAVTATYITPEDETRTVYRDLLRSTFTR